LQQNIEKLRTALDVAGNADGAALVEFNKYMSSLDQMLAVTAKKLTNVAIAMATGLASNATAENATPIVDITTPSPMITNPNPAAANVNVWY
jgi:hypothetical protein